MFMLFRTSWFTWENTEKSKSSSINNNKKQRQQQHHQEVCVTVIIVVHNIKMLRRKPNEYTKRNYFRCRRKTRQTKFIRIQTFGHSWFCSFLLAHLFRSRITMLNTSIWWVDVLTLHGIQTFAIFAFRFWNGKQFICFALAVQTHENK